MKENIFLYFSTLPLISHCVMIEVTYDTWFVAWYIL